MSCPRDCAACWIPVTTHDRLRWREALAVVPLLVLLAVLLLAGGADAAELCARSVCS